MSDINFTVSDEPSPDFYGDHVRYCYRLVFPRSRRQGMSEIHVGDFMDKKLPFHASVGDILDIDQGVFRVFSTARMAFCDETMLFLERWL